jgi:hypothetical protein
MKIKKPFREGYIRYIEDFTEKELEKILRKGIERYADEIYSRLHTPYTVANRELLMYTGIRHLSEEEKSVVDKIFKKIQLSQGLKEEDICYSWKYDY